MSDVCWFCPDGNEPHRHGTFGPILLDAHELAEMCRRLKRSLHEASTRVDALDSFARRAGGILENIWVSYSLVPEKNELAPLVEELHRLFPSDQSMEF